GPGCARRSAPTSRRPGRAAGCVAPRTCRARRKQRTGRTAARRERDDAWADSRGWDTRWDAAGGEKVASAIAGQIWRTRSARRLLRLGQLPQCLLLGQVAPGERAAFGGGQLFHLAEAPLELRVGMAQRPRKVDAGMAGQVHRDKQHVADLVFEPRRIGAAGELRTHLVDLL